MQVHRNRPQRKTKPVVAGLLGFLVIVAAAFGGALFWQTAQEAQARLESPSAAAAPLSAAVAGSVSATAENAGASAVSESSHADTASAASSAESAPETIPEEAPEDERPATTGRGLSFAANPEDRAGAPGDANFAAEGGDEAGNGVTPGFAVEWQVPITTAKADNSYFDNAIFFGDSVSTGITGYNVANNTACVAAIGVSPQNALTFECVLDAAGNMQTLLEAARAHGEREKVYIMLGGNGLGQEKAGFIASYQEFINAVRERYPRATVYIQSMTPVTSAVQVKYGSVTPAKVREYNEAIALLAKENGLPFVNVFEALCNESGLLPTDVSPNDGLHLSAEYYFKWFDYLKYHTVEGHQ